MHDCTVRAARSCCIDTAALGLQASQTRATTGRGHDVQPMQGGARVLPHAVALAAAGTTGIGSLHVLGKACELDSLDLEPARPAPRLARRGMFPTRWYSRARERISNLDESSGKTWSPLHPSTIAIEGSHGNIAAGRDCASASLA